MYPPNLRQSSSNSGITTCTIPNCNCSPVALNNNSPTGNNNNNNPTCNSESSNNPMIDHQYAIRETHFTCGQCSSSSSSSCSSLLVPPSQTFLKLVDYMNHLKHEHCVEVYRCMLCKQMQLFDNVNLLKEHFFQVHASTKTEFYRCRLCTATTNISNSSCLFTNTEELNAHIQLEHGNNVNNNNIIYNDQTQQPRLNNLNTHHHLRLPLYIIHFININ